MMREIYVCEGDERMNTAMDICAAIAHVAVTPHRSQAGSEYNRLKSFLRAKLTYTFIAGELRAYQSLASPLCFSFSLRSGVFMPPAMGVPGPSGTSGCGCGDSGACGSVRLEHVRIQEATLLSTKDVHRSVPNVISPSFVMPTMERSRYVDRITTDDTIRGSLALVYRRLERSAPRRPSVNPSPCKLVK
jgi:hypothetical protein